MKGEHWMKKLLVSFVSIFFIMAATFLAFADNRVDLFDPASAPTPSTFDAPPLGEPFLGSGPLLYDNGPLVNSPGTGMGGADESLLQTSLGMTVYGFGCQTLYNYWIADDFTVPSGSTWTLGSMTFYLFQAGSTTNSTITGMNVRIYNVSPDTSGATPIAESNTIISTTWANIYRVTDDNSGSDTTLPVMATVVDMGDLVLPAGTYWAAWQASGSLSSGPWQPPITITGQTNTGNGLQFADQWYPVIDLGTETPQGFPFLIHGPEAGPVAAVPSLDAWGKFFLILIFGFGGLYYVKRKTAEMC
jgi:hypothetical protein